MSANRSVQAAQRRRAGPPEPQAPGRPGPQPSINSAQMFANQARPGPGPNIPPGRLAGMQQQQMQQQQMQSQQMQQTIGSVNKMTLPQAITLITLRLGALETKMMGGESNFTRSEDNESTGLIDTGVIESIMERVEELEKRPISSNTTTSTVSQPDILLLKQQFETVKSSVIQSKNISTTIVKENKDLKIQIETLRNELQETKELVNVLQQMVLDNSQKITNLSLNTNYENDNILDEYNENLNDTNIEIENIVYCIEENDVQHDGNDYDNDDYNGQNQIIGNNLKEMIENEMKDSV